MVNTAPRLAGVAERMDDPGLDARELAAPSGPWPGSTASSAERGPSSATSRDSPTGCPRRSVSSTWARICGHPAGRRPLGAATRRPVEITALDRSPGPGRGRSSVRDYRRSPCSAATGWSLPFPRNSFDVSLASQILHHMEAASRSSAGELWRVGRGMASWSMTSAEEHGPRRDVDSPPSHVPQPNHPTRWTAVDSPRLHTRGAGGLARAARMEGTAGRPHAFFRLALLEEKR